MRQGGGGVGEPPPRGVGLPTPGRAARLPVLLLMGPAGHSGHTQVERVACGSFLGLKIRPLNDSEEFLDQYS